MIDLTLACSGLVDVNTRLITTRHDFCTGQGVALVPGRVEYRTASCGCPCHVWERSKW